MDRHEEADKIVRTHVMWSMGAGLMPVPLFDIAAVTAVQMDMLRQLAAVYEVDYTGTAGKAFVSGLTGSTVARIGASLVKIVPGIGTVIGGISMPLLSGASTYAVGQVAIGHFGSRGDLRLVDLESAKRAYEDAFERGKDFVSGLKSENRAAKEAYESLEKLAQLREKGVLTEEEFEARKKAVLEGLST